MNAKRKKKKMLVEEEKDKWAKNTNLSLYLAYKSYVTVEGVKRTPHLRQGDFVAEETSCAPRVWGLCVTVVHTQTSNDVAPSPTTYFK